MRNPNPQQANRIPDVRLRASRKRPKAPMIDKKLSKVSGLGFKEFRVSGLGFKEFRVGFRV